MQGNLTKLRNFAENESGATAIEYGLIAALVSVAVIGSLRSYGASLVNLFSALDGALAIAGATDPSPPPAAGGSGGCSAADIAAGLC